MKIICLTSLIIFYSGIFSQTTEKPNILFIVVDDLNDYIAGYDGNPQIQTPAIASLEEEGTTFMNAYCNAPGCAPSRTSFLSGKDQTYTHCYNNSDYAGVFQNQFTTELGNDEVFTLPQILKDSGQYFTYGINKIFHAENENDYDDYTTDACSKKLSWNKMEFFDDPDALVQQFYQYKFDDTLLFGAIPDSLEPEMKDYLVADKANQFISDFASGIAETCGKPFFLALGFSKPHAERFIPKKYFQEDYLDSLHQTPFNIPFNYPAQSFPYNGIVMPPQPEIQYGDYLEFPDGSIAKFLADANSEFINLFNYAEGISEFPEFEESFTDDEKHWITQETVRAEYVMAYIAAVQFVDAQIGRVLEQLNAFPELKNNTIIILVSDHGYALGEKRHFTKWVLWEPVIKSPVIISYPGKTAGKISHHVISLLDLFPTICNLTQTPPPIFSNGISYLDGNDFSNYLSSPDLHVENVAVTAYKKNLGTASCFPQYSLRNNRFHYIQYHTNNGGEAGGNVCNSETSKTEEELYDLGIKNETDPEEWNNLAENEDYLIVKEYLSQFIPGQIKYKKQTNQIIIQEQNSACVYYKYDELHFTADLYDLSGNLLTEIPVGKTMRWWTNKGFFQEKSLSVSIDLSALEQLSDEDEILIYAALYDNITNAIDALDIKKILLSANENDFPQFQVSVKDKTISVSSIQFPENTISALWNYGDGFLYEGFYPPQHTYLDSAIYTLRCNALTFLTDTCSAGNELSFLTGTNSTISTYTDEDIIMNVYPNPANTDANISIYALPGEYTLKIFSLNGEKMLSRQIQIDYANFIYHLSLEKFGSGVYVVQLNSAESSVMKKFLKN